LSLCFEGKCRNCGQVGHELFKCENCTNPNGGNNNTMTGGNYSSYFCIPGTCQTELLLIEPDTAMINQVIIITVTVTKKAITHKLWYFAATSKNENFTEDNWLCNSGAGGNY
jgi:hypothetical protein